MAQIQSPSHCRQGITYKQKQGGEMEFERAIYRVYERCLEGLREDQDANGSANMKSCKFLEVLTFGCGLFLLFVLIGLHSAFVGSPGCLPSALTAAAAQMNITNATAYPYLQKDQVLYINIDQKYVPQKGLRDVNGGESASIVPMTPGRDTHWSYFSNNADRIVKKGSEWVALDRLRGSQHSHQYNQHTIQSQSAMSTMTPFDERMYPQAENVTETSTGKSGGSDLEPEYDYKFTFNSALLLLPYSELKQHQFTTMNVSLLGEACYGSAFSQSMVPLGGVDTLVVNALMYTFKQPGHVFTAQGDYFRWTAQDIVPYSSVPEWINFKVAILFYSLFAFFFLTTITALLVRILISSGVVLIFPIFWVLQLFGFAPLNLRIVAISYPWIGLPLELIRARNQSIVPFIIGHLSRVVVYYFLYQSTQLVFAVWFYNRDSPGQQELWIFGIMMFWEYFSMIYVRALGSIQLFPRVSLALFLIYHIYYFSFPSGFHVLALVVMFFFLVSLMVHCIREYEIKDFERGVINLDQPRALYNSLPWPVWNADLAPDFTLMMPLSHRSQSAYQTNIPTLRPTAAAATPNTPTNQGANAGGGVLNPLQTAVAGAGTSGVWLGQGAHSPVRDSAAAGVSSGSTAPAASNTSSHDANGNIGGGIELGSVTIMRHLLNTQATSRNSTQYSRLAQGSSHGLIEESSSDSIERGQG